MFTASDVAKLRERTGAGMMDCKKALTECKGSMDKAADYLREKGIAGAAKKADRIAAEGIVDSYIHMKGKIGVLVEVNCETDFVAKSDEFRALTHDIALQIAASKPLYVSADEIPADILEKEKQIYRAKAINEGKKPEIADRIVEGSIKKFYKEVCLLDQEFIKDTSITISQLVTNAVAKIGEKITVRRFARYEMGEGIEKRSNDLAKDVAEQVAKMKK